MKLVKQFIDPGEASKANRRLRRAGVMTTLTGYDPHVLKKAEAKTLRIGLWVVFDDQLDDAARLLEDPEHLPRRVVSRQEMNRLETAELNSQSGSNRSMAGKPGRSILLGILILLGIYLLTRFTSDT